MSDPKRETRAPESENKFGSVGSFQIEEFARTIQKVGLRFHWSRAVECPCSMTDSDQFDPSCARCQGDGWWYVNPSAYDESHSDRDYFETRAIFASGRGGEDQFKPFGEVSSGEAGLTIQSHLSVSYRDRFIGIDQKMSRSETLVRGTGRAAGTIVAVGKGKARTTAEQREALRYEPLHVSFAADGAGQVYYPRRDFVLLERQLTEPARMRWLPNKGPAEGARYAVHYDFCPVWVVDGAGQVYPSQAIGPARGTKGAFDVRDLPTSFKVLLDFLTPARGS